MQYVLVYAIHSKDDVTKIEDAKWKFGSSEEALEKWAKENNLEDYIICLPMYEVKKLRRTINTAEQFIEDMEGYFNRTRSSLTYNV